MRAPISALPEPRHARIFACQGRRRAAHRQARNRVARGSPGPAAGAGPAHIILAVPVRPDVLRAGHFLRWTRISLCVSGDFPHSCVRRAGLSLCVSCDSDSSDGAEVFVKKRKMIAKKLIGEWAPAIPEGVVWCRAALRLLEPPTVMSASQSSGSNSEYTPAREAAPPKPSWTSQTGFRLVRPPQGSPLSTFQSRR